jgi:hypothetical protein
VNRGVVERRRKQDRELWRQLERGWMSLTIEHADVVLQMLPIQLKPGPNIVWER